MGSMARWYVRCGDDAELLARLRKQHSAAVIDAPSAFASLPAPDDVGEAGVLEMSNRYGAEVIYLGFVSSTDSFAFTHCVDGRCVRHLRYGWAEEERWWEVVVGEPEGWERGAFFEEAQLADIDEGDPERDEIVELFRLGRVRAGTGWPILDAREAARAAAVHYRLTDWIDDWGEGANSPRREITTPSGSIISVQRSATAGPAPPPATPTEPAAPQPAASDRPSPPVDRPNEATKKPWWRFW
ncbi:MAG: hypothetical protein ACOZNI_27970 [Myxococcota bacterium]